MKLAWKRAAAAGVLCLGLAVAGSAGAQGRPAGAGGPPNGAGAGERQKRFDEFRQQREQRLHDLLQIRPEQEGAFRTYVAAIEAGRGGKGGPGGGPRGERGPGARAPMTTPERLDRMAARMAERQQRFQQISAATKTFYGGLSPDQRKAFDAMPMTMGHGHGHFGRPGGARQFGGPPR